MIEALSDLVNIRILTEVNLSLRSIPDDSNSQKPGDRPDLFDLICLEQLILKAIIVLCVLAIVERNHVVNVEEYDEVLSYEEALLLI